MSTEGAPLRDPHGGSDFSGLRFAVLVSRFHGEITASLMHGAVATIEEHGGDAPHVEVMHVPGAWELPQAAARTVASPRGYDAVIALGCVVRGETPHFDYVCQQVTLGLGAVAREAEVPVVFGVLTTDTLEQAHARSGDGDDNKGREAAFAAIDMLTVYRQLST